MTKIYQVTRADGTTTYVAAEENQFYSPPVGLSDVSEHFAAASNLKNRTLKIWDSRTAVGIVVRGNAVGTLLLSLIGASDDRVLVHSLLNNKHLKRLHRAWIEP